MQVLFFINRGCLRIDRKYELHKTEKRMGGHSCGCMIYSDGLNLRFNDLQTVLFLANEN